MRNFLGSILVLIIFSINLNAQTSFSSSKYPYSFTIPDGWHVKNKIYFAAVDTKIVDGRGNSFIISVINMPNEFKGKSATAIFSQFSDDEIKMSQSPTDFENIIISKRGTTYIGGKPILFCFLQHPIFRWVKTKS